jgi:hypothetical protein
MMARERRQQGEGRASAADLSARNALEHPHILFRFQRDPLEVALHTRLEQADSGSAARQPPRRRAKSG